MINILYNNKVKSDDYTYNPKAIRTEGIQDYNICLDKITLVKGRLPENNYETIVNISNEETLKLNKESDVKIADKKLVVVGYYTSQEDINIYFVNNNMIKTELITKAKTITVYPENKEQVLNEFRSNFELNIYDNYQKDKKDYLAGKSKGKAVLYAGAGIILCISLIEIFLMSRSSFLSRVKEVGIYRAIGVKKKDIYIMFSGEIIAITTLTSLLGVSLCAYIMKVLTEIPGMETIILINLKTYLEAVIICYGFNLLVGLIPVYAVLRKRPAEILARTDLD